MQDLFKLLVVGILVAIIISLGSALFHLSREHGDSKKMVRALSFRIGLSLALFALLMVAWWMGLVQPHGIGR